MRALAIIPARGGSRGISKKFVRPLASKPLLAHTIEAAQASRVFDRIILTTDSPEIAVVGRDWGVDVPFMRPAELSGDATPSIAVLQHAAQFMIQRDGPFDVICTLQPADPFRHLPSLRVGFLTLQNDSSADSAVAVSPIPYRYSPDFAFKISDGLLLPFNEADTEFTRREEARLAYSRNGQFYFTRAATLLEGHSLFGARSIPIVIPAAPSVSLDSLENWQAAELLIERGLLSLKFD